LQVQESLHRDPHVGDLYVFRGKRGDLLKIRFPGENCG
jgi:transposase